MEIITGYTGKPHVTSEQDRDVNIGVVGEGSYVLQTGMQLAAEVSSNNEIKIRDGVLMHQGCTASIKKNTYDSLTITNGSQGMKRIDLIVARYEKNQDNGIESLDLKVIQGTPAESNPAAPQYTEGDIQAGDYVADMPMYQVIIEGLNITEVKKMFKVIGSNKDLSNKVAELNSKTIQIIKNGDSQQIYDLCGGKIRVVSGSAVKNVRGTDYICLIDKDELNEIFGQSYSSIRLSIATCNGDNEATNTRFLGAEIWQGHIYQYFAQKLSCSVRINYRVVYIYP